MRELDLKPFAKSLADDLKPYAGSLLHIGEDGRVSGKAVAADCFCDYELSEIFERYGPGIVRVPEHTQSRDVHSAHNPFKKASWNLTKQIELARDNPQLAATLRGMA